MVAIVMAPHAGMTTAEFEKIVKDWLATARHPILGHAAQNPPCKLCPRGRTAARVHGHRGAGDAPGRRRGAPERFGQGSRRHRVLAAGAKLERVEQQPARRRHLRAFGRIPEETGSPTRG